MCIICTFLPSSTPFAVETPVNATFLQNIAVFGGTIQYYFIAVSVKIVLLWVFTRTPYMRSFAYPTAYPIAYPIAKKGLILSFCYSRQNVLSTPFKRQVKPAQ